jgi:hypothetical protein
MTFDLRPKSPSCKRACDASLPSTSSRSKAMREEAGYSMLGPVALNVFAPDEGNMQLLEAVATAAQRPRPGGGWRKS